jgi:leucyl aminopeptidase
VGKGVCFDTGGLDLKSSSAMKLMKKDMGGAAIMLGLAQMVMAANLPVRLRLLIPAVENVVAGNALKPLDVVRARNGMAIEIGNTDAEGRVILADALAEAAAEEPALLVDCATLTGAARVALGTEVAALFCPDDGLADDLLRQAETCGDPMWRLPLWPGYRRHLDGKTAPLTNAPDSPYGGAILAALFLAAFIEPVRAWVHLDVMAWNTDSRPGRPEGGEAMGMRALFALIEARWGR